MRHRKGDAAIQMGLRRKDGAILRRIRRTLPKAGGLAVAVTVVAVTVLSASTAAVDVPGAIGVVPSAPGASGQPLGTEGPQDAITVFLVRHAEKDVTVADDPPLTPAGQRRADTLADLLEDAGITAVHTTDFRRTRDTALPLARRLGQEPGVYNARLLSVLAERIRTTPGRHLVVGHSDTTPEMVRLLGGEPGSPIVEDGEYDRLYVLTIQPDGTATTVLLRYGERFRNP